MSTLPPPAKTRPGREGRQPFPPSGEKSIAHLCRRLPNFRLFRQQVMKSQAETEKARKRAGVDAQQ